MKPGTLERTIRAGASVASQSSVLSLGIALLSPVGGLLIVHFGYRAAFSVFAATTAIILAFFLLYFVPRERQLAAGT